MGKVLITLEDDTEERFREIILQLFGDKRGALSIAAEQAIREWNLKNDNRLRF